MSKVIYIKANPKNDEASYTFKMSERFISEYRRKNPKDEIITLDLYDEQIRFLSGKDLNDMLSMVDFDVRRYAEQFASADKYIIAAPFWNLSFPAILKAYFDYVTFVGITFKYTEQGPVGLLAGKNKKAAYIVARGGMYSTPEMCAYECGEKYIRTILGFLGITEVTTHACEMTAVFKGDDLNNIVDKAVAEAGAAALDF